ncbi:AI-2E family transporter [Microbacteriaceae bacterium VKM Ac-2855]|nr:AI-2E family transporter [Microbacteriaceae bacterium VKM Ac-2855]
MKIRNAFQLGLVGTLGVGLGLVIIESISSLATILTYVGAALFIALGLDPIVTWLEHRRFPRWAAILTVLVAVLGAVAGILGLVVPIIVDQATQFINRVPDLVATIQSQQWIDGLYAQFGRQNVDGVLNYVSQTLESADYASIASGALAVGLSVANNLVGALIILILTLYFTASLTSVKGAVYLLVPASKRDRFVDLAEQIMASVGRYVTGQVALALCNGLLSFFFLSFIGAELPAVFAAVAFLFSLIPLVGTITGSAIIVLSELLLASPATALTAAIYYLVYMQIEAYILSPRIMNRAVAVPGAIVVIAALAGGSLLGPLGALVAIPFAAALLLIIRQVLVPRQSLL